MSKWAKVESDVEKGPWGLFKWFAIGIISLALLFGGLRSIGLIGSTIVERKVFENSYQKVASDNSRITYLETGIADIEMKLATGQGDPKVLRAQQQFLMVQLKAAQSTK